MTKKILIIEDEVILLEALRNKFSSKVFQVFTAADGIEGLEVAKKEHPDLILLDLVMPRMDGMTMLKILRQDAWGKLVPVIILTNLNESEKIEESIKNGVFDYLVKVNRHLDDVVKKVKNRLNIKLVV
ncbi:MAG: Response regulator receiver protein [Candidatus Magasanikbacteria bacterium GW2011_GWA2_37_8]|uniref:Response regulator receiver protein n=1 Tax=Candidatus Magasanikbacteria bacterium GW2011_GWA2_37_8 TaxID=1619036 RepID=A0A0G0HFB5_9BACT|nr:MAG: Response regulator receiver protein [Candidatus Magasanikbacteria bacterium GW2011_GWA2_37_8]